MSRIEISEAPIERDIYLKLISVLSGIKLVGGNIFLNKTIHNHPIAKNFLLNYLKDDLIDIEREISYLERSND